MKNFEEAFFFKIIVEIHICIPLCIFGLTSLLTGKASMFYDS